MQLTLHARELSGRGTVGGLDKVEGMKEMN